MPGMDAPPEPAASVAAPAASAEPPKASEPSKGSGAAKPPEPAKPASKGEATSDSRAPAASGGYAGDDPCQTMQFHYGAVKAACHSGGRRAAKEVMKGALGRAKAAGQDLKCTSCHEDTKSFHLKANAVADLKAWL